MSTKNKLATDVLQKLLGRITFGKLLKSHRLGLGLTQVQMAKKLGIIKQELCNIEKGRKIISPERAKKFAEILEYSPQIFIKYVIQDQLAKIGITTEIEFKKAA
jgi:transcriptional regulator with XRE-family HTH domain